MQYVCSMCRNLQVLVGTTHKHTKSYTCKWQHTIVVYFKEESIHLKHLKVINHNTLMYSCQFQRNGADLGKETKTHNN